MFNEPILITDREDLLRAIRQVRNRWRLKVLLRGTAAVVGAGPGGVPGVGLRPRDVPLQPGRGRGLPRRACTRSSLGLVGWFLVRPLLRRVTDQQVALYIEEHEPELQAAIVSAIDADSPEARAAQPGVARAGEEGGRARGREVPRDRLRARARAAHLPEVVGGDRRPARRRDRADAVRPGVPAARGDGAAPARREPRGREPVPHRRGAWRRDGGARLRRDREGDPVGLRRGRGRRVHAAEPQRAVRADAARRRRGGGPVRGASCSTSQGPTDYFVQAAGVRSPVYTLQAADTFYVQQLRLVLRFPAYTGLEPRTVDHGGDLAVLKGTAVEVRATPTMKVPAGEVRLDEATRVPLAVEADGTLTGGLHRDEERLLPDRPAGDLGHDGGHLAPVHDRRAGRPAAHRVVLEARARRAPDQRRRGVRGGAGRTTTSAWGGSTSCTR